MRKLTRQQLDAVVFAVETLCEFALCDAQSAIRKLCKLDERVAKLANDHRGALRYLGLLE